MNILILNKYKAHRNSEIDFLSTGNATFLLLLTDILQTDKKEYKATKGCSAMQVVVDWAAMAVKLAQSFDFFHLLSFLDQRLPESCDVNI